MSETKEQNYADGRLSNMISDLGKRVVELEESIAQLKSIDLSVRELQSIFDGFAAGLQHGLAVVQDGNIVWANKAGCDMFGYEIDELINTSGIVLAHPDYREKLVARLSMIQAGDVLPTYDIWPFLTKGRVVKQIKSYANRIIYGGKPAILTILVDVTEEKALQDAISMRAEMLELVSELVYMLDMKGNIKYANKAMCESLGYTYDEIIGKNILEFHTKEHKERVKIRLKLATPASHGRYKTEYICKDGTGITVSVNGKVINLGGKEYVLGVARSIIHDEPTAPI